MPGIRFVADSTADLPEDFRTAKRIVTVPLKIVFGDETLVDGVDVTPETFYDRMRRSERNPTTSQPTPLEFETAFREAAADGDAVICTCMSSAMSGTHGAAMQAREAVPDLDVTVIDTRTVSVGHQLVVRAAVARAEAGAPAAAVVEHVEALLPRLRAVFTVATLEYLRRGGRIGGARALLGSMLSIKPVLQVLDGHIEAYDKVRTNQRALERMAAELAAAAGEAGHPAAAVVAHAERGAEAQSLAEMVAPHCVEPPTVGLIGPIVGCHAGPGTVGLAFHVMS